MLPTALINLGSHILVADGKRDSVDQPDKFTASKVGSEIFSLVIYSLFMSNNVIHRESFLVRYGRQSPL